MSKKTFDRNVPGKLFKPVFRNDANQATRLLSSPDGISYTYDLFKDTNLDSTSSYRYGDKPYYVSNQQAIGNGGAARTRNTSAFSTNRSEGETIQINLPQRRSLGTH